MITHELSYAPPMSMATSKLDSTCNEGSYARYEEKLDDSMKFSSILKAQNLGSSRAFLKISEVDPWWRQKRDQYHPSQHDPE